RPLEPKRVRLDDAGRDHPVEPLVRSERRAAAVVEEQQQGAPHAVGTGAQQARGDQAPHEVEQADEVLAEREADRIADELAWVHGGSGPGIGAMRREAPRDRPSPRPRGTRASEHYL